MQTNKIIKRGKNLLIYLPNEGTSNTLDQAVKKYFLNNKKLITEFAVINELVLTSENFSITSQSIYTSLGISDKTLKTKLDNLKRDGILFSFQFSIGLNKSKVFYILNLSGERIGELSAYYDLLQHFPKCKDSTLITYKSKNMKEIQGSDQVILDNLFKCYKKNKLKNVMLNDKIVNYLKNSLFETICPFINEINPIDEDEKEKLFNQIISTNLI